MADFKYIEIPCIKVQQPVGSFYIASIGHKDLLRICYADVRRLETHTTQLEQYIGIQRLLSGSRVRELRNYVTLSDATFPTGIIVQIDEHAKIEEDGTSVPLVQTNDAGEQDLVRNVFFDSDNRYLRIRDSQDVAKILDGQHRIEGLRDCQLLNEEFELNVAIFVDMDIEDQAIVFATINKSQTKVNKSLVADLFEYANNRSPQKTAHDIARALNQKPGSPFKGKIKILGKAEHDTETITQATFVEGLLKYISGNNLRAMSDRDAYKRGRKPERVTGKEAERLFLREMFLDENDAGIAQNLWNYFSAVSEKWPDAWNKVRVDSILNKSTGFVALMKFFKDAYQNLSQSNDEIVSKEQFRSVLEKIGLKDDEFTKKIYVPGGIGQALLYKHLKDESKINERP